jgi:hypothetical protein
MIFHGPEATLHVFGERDSLLLPHSEHLVERIVNQLVDE